MKALMLALLCAAAAATAQETTDSAAIAAIKDEGLNRSGVLETLSDMTDVYGPRLTWSPGYIRAARWAEKELKNLGLSNVVVEPTGPAGRGWTLKKYSANVIASQNFPLISYPKAWSPSASATGELIHLKTETDSALDTYKGKLGGKFVLMSDERKVDAHFEPEATRTADSSLLKMANAEPSPGRQGRRQEQTAEQKARAMTQYRAWRMMEDEGAAGVLTASRGDGGNIFVQGASVTVHPDTPSASRISAYSPKAPDILPQLAVGAEHYNRLIRMLAEGEKPKLELELDVAFGKADSVYNIIAEIPGTDLAQEVVMIGAHFDSWQGGTGATDNGTGSAVCMEAMRILKATGLKPRRTIRIALWGGEEQGLHGSRGYVKRHLGSGETASFMDTPKEISYLPEAEHFSVYFNNDNGTGKVRGIYMQGNEATRPIFRAWLKDFGSLGASTLTLSNTGGTDHLPFDAIGLPGFQFIQDQVEYGTRTHHSTMDLFERAQEEDLKQASVIMAAFAWNAAMRDAKFPRKPLPQPPPAASGSTGSN